MSASPTQTPLLVPRLSPGERERIVRAMDTATVLLERVTFLDEYGNPQRVRFLMLRGE